MSEAPLGLAVAVDHTQVLGAKSAPISSLVVKFVYLKALLSGQASSLLSRSSRKLKLRIGQGRFGNPDNIKRGVNFGS